MKESEIKVYTIEAAGDFGFTQLYLMVDPNDEDGDCFMLRNSIISDRAVYFGLAHLDDLISGLNELREKLTQSTEEK